MGAEHASAPARHGPEGDDEPGEPSDQEMQGQKPGLPNFRLSTMQFVLRVCFADTSLRVGLKLTSACVIVSDVDACRATSIFTGLLRTVFVIRSISGAIVSVKHSV